MILDEGFIMFKGMPLFQRARSTTPSGRLNNLQDLACFFYIVEGNYEAIESNGAFRVGTKEALIKKCGNYVAHFYGTETKQECEAVAIYLYPDLLHEIYKDELPSFLNEETIKNPPKVVVANELIDTFINNLFIYFENPSMIDDELAILKLKEFVLLLLKSEQYSSVQKFLSEIFSPGKLKFSNIIENNLFSNVTIEELAFVCNMSLSSFKREFKKTYNETPARYIKSKRLERAAYLITHTTDSISGIGYDCGFQDATTFSASFQVQFGTTPTKYRMN